MQLCTYQRVEVSAAKETEKKDRPAGDQYCRLCFAPQRTPGYGYRAGKSETPLLRDRGKLGQEAQLPSCQGDSLDRERVSQDFISARARVDRLQFGFCAVRSEIIYLPDVHGARLFSYGQQAPVR